MSLYSQLSRFQTHIVNQVSELMAALTVYIKQVYDTDYSAKHTAALALITHQEKNTAQKYLLATIILGTLPLLFIKALSYIYLWPFHIATLAWTEHVTSLLGLPLLGYISLPVALYMGIVLLHVIQLPKNNNDYQPSNSTIIGYAIALVAPLICPILFHMAVVSALCLMIWTETSQTSNFKGLEKAKNQTLSTTEKFHYTVITTLLLLHSSQILLRSFSITAAMASNPITACAYLAIIGLILINALILPQYCYSLPSVGADTVTYSIDKEVAARKTLKIPEMRAPLFQSDQISQHSHLHTSQRLSTSDKPTYSKNTV